MNTSSDMPRKSFAEQCREWRGTRSQAKAAKVLRIPLDTLQNWEQGRCEPKHKAMVRAMMDVNPDLS